MSKTEQIKEELLALLGDEKDALLKVDTVIEWARSNPGSALHSQYQWDLEKAAVEHWRWQTRRLIQLHVVVGDSTPLMVNLTIDRSKAGGGYRRMSDVVANRDLTDVMMDDALAELERIHARYSMLAALAGVFKEFELVRAKRRKAA